MDEVLGFVDWVIDEGGCVGDFGYFFDIGFFVDEGEGGVFFCEDWVDEVFDVFVCFCDYVDGWDDGVSKWWIVL